MVRTFLAGLTILEYTADLSNIFIGLDPPFTAANVIFGGLLMLLGVGFTLMLTNLTKKIHTLKKQQRILEA